MTIIIQQVASSDGFETKAMAAEFRLADFSIYVRQAISSDISEKIILLELRPIHRPSGVGEKLKYHAAFWPISLSPSYSLLAIFLSPPGL